MSEINCIDGAVQNWETIKEGVEKIVLRAVIYFYCD